MLKEMTRDEFEEWIDDHRDEVIAELPLRGTSKPLGAWLAVYYNALKQHTIAGNDDGDDEDVGDEEDETGFGDDL